MKKFFVEDKVIGDKVEIVGEEFFHLNTVLRTKPDERIVILNNSDYEYQAIVESVGKTSAICKVEKKVFCGANPKIRIDIFQGMPKGEKLDFLVQKTTELGATSLTPFESEFTIAKNNPIKIERVRKIAKEACKQCGRSACLVVNPTIKFINLEQYLKNYDLIIFTYEHAGILEKINKLNEEISKAKNIAIIIGSEGGFSEKEVGILEKFNVKKVSLGKRILRTETACIATLAYINFLTGD